MRDHYNDRVPTPSPVGEQTFAEGGQFDAQSGRTYFSNNGNPVWAQVQDLEGIGVLPDGSVVGHLSNDRFARPLYEIIKARDTGEMDPIDAAERIDMLAWEMAIQKYPKFDDVYNRVNAYKDNLRRIKNRKLEYYDIPDVTERMNEIIEKAEEDSIRLIIDCMLSPEVDDRRKYSLFYEHVASGKEYDLKQWPEFQEHALFMLDGEIVSRDALGNILYGYLGKAYGFSDSDLFDGAGLAQIMDRNSKWTWGETHFDDPRDQKRIQQGISLYLKTH